jgi:2-C-methyl-D-erythritol 4-phosphate cytidylyltransferase
MGEDKMFCDLGGLPVVARTLMAIDKCACVDEIVVVTREDMLEQVAKIANDLCINKARKFLIGGEDRLHSAIAGVFECDSRAKLIGIHDGARPFASEKLVSEVVSAAWTHRAAAPGVPVTDTIKVTSESFVDETPARASLTAVQTPQVFQADIIKCALTNAAEKELSVTDDCSAVEAIGVPVFITDGDADNIKLTVQRDLDIAKVILSERGETQ